MGLYTPVRFLSHPSIRGDFFHGAFFFREQIKESRKITPAFLDIFSAIEEFPGVPAPGPRT